MPPFLDSPTLFVHAAAVCYVIALGIRDQLILRLLILLGTGFYIAYYLVAAQTPLWEAAGWSILMAAVNLVVIIQLIRERSTLSMDEEERMLYGAFTGLTPGEFRSLLKLGHWEIGDGKQLLTQENENNDRLYYLVEGHIEGDKKGLGFEVKAPSFLGEVSMVLNCPATATVVASKDCRYLYWDRSDLDALQKRKPSIAIALSALLKVDLARKVAAGHAPAKGLRVSAAR